MRTGTEGTSRPSAEMSLTHVDDDGRMHADNIQEVTEQTAVSKMDKTDRLRT